MLASDFSSLYQTSYSYIYQLVFSVNHNHQFTEDAVQEIYLAAWLRFRGNPHPNPFGWLVITARHKACDMLRRQLRESQRCIPLEDSIQLSRLPAFSDSQIDRFLEEDTPYERVRALLKEDEFSLLISYYENEVSITELSERLGISTSACYMRLHRARRKLETLLQTSCGPTGNQTGHFA